MNRKDFLKYFIGLGTFAATPLKRLVGYYDSKVPAMVEEKPIVIVGSGYGGAVAALRLCEAGKKVCLLEMGLNWQISGERFSPMKRPGKSAAWLRTRTIAPFFNIFPLKPFTGVLDRLDFPGIKIWVGRGVGGGSLVNGGMAVMPKKEFFEEVFPDIDSDAFYQHYFPLASKELKVNSISDDFLRRCAFYKFTNVGKREALKAGFHTIAVPNVYDFSYMEKEYDGKEPRSALAGEVIYGNNFGKNSLDKTYLMKAMQTENLEILDLHHVKEIVKHDDGNLALHVDQIDTSGKTLSSKTINCSKLVLAAGTMGTLDLLLKAKSNNSLNVNEQIGKHWGNNGNIMTGRNWVKAFSPGLGAKQSTIPVAGIDNWDDPDHSFFAEIAPLPMGMNVATAIYLLINRVTKPGSVSFNKEQQKLTLNWGRENTANMERNARYFVQKMNRANGGTLSHLLFHNGFGYDICYHPLGGAVLGKATTRFGELAGEENIFIIDGSLIPGNIGVNPFLTITALAEYCVENLLKTGRFDT